MTLQGRYQSDIPRLDALIATAGAQHLADVSRLSLAISDANTRHQMDVTRLDSSIADATARQQADVSRLDASITTAGTQHQADVARLESLISTEKQALSSVQLELRQLLSDLSADVTNLKILVEQDTTPRLTSAESSINSINNQIVDINTAITTLDQQVVNLDERVVLLEAASVIADPVTVVGTLCLSVSNSSGIDINNKDWFDQCIATQGDSVRVVLKDAAGEVVYSAYGMKNNVWTQDNITSSAVAREQYLSFNHNYMITLNNGDNLMISGKSAANTGCGGSFGNGYGITLYGPFPNYISNPIMLVMPFNQFNTYVGARKFYGWTALHEITYKDSVPFGTCSQVNGSSVAESSFVGTFEFYVY
ncbi:MAG: hypothetical protein OEY43_06005 [Gammaproteobacteria bacterium]|nr:hypothetical protein [Gammaproteobacteria bacterium]